MALDRGEYWINLNCVAQRTPKKPVGFLGIGLTQKNQQSPGGPWFQAAGLGDQVFSNLVFIFSQAKFFILFISKFLDFYYSEVIRTKKEVVIFRYTG